MGQTKARCGYRPESLEVNNSPSELTEQEIDQNPRFIRGAIWLFSGKTLRIERFPVDSHS
jgi:hypothetical protein